MLLMHGSARRVGREFPQGRNKAVTKHQNGEQQADLKVDLGQFTSRNNP